VILCQDTVVVSPDRQQNGATATEVGTRVRIIATTTGRQLAYRWSVPRSPAGKLLALPVLVVAALLMVLVFLFAAVLVVGAAAVAFCLAVLVRGRHRETPWQPRP
jgi:hypothetical protein